MALGPHQKVHALTPTPRVDALLRQIIADNPNAGEDEHRREFKARIDALRAQGGDEADALMKEIVASAVEHILLEIEAREAGEKN